MGIGVSLVLIAVGAILRYGVTRSVQGVNLANVGAALIVVGAIGLVISLILAAMARRRVVVRDDPTYVDADRDPRP